MTEGLSRFRTDMDKVAQLASAGPMSSKAQRYLRAYEAGLPQDITVRWFPKGAVEAMSARVDELTRQNLEVWISQGLPWNPDVDQQIASVEKKTDLIKGLKSLDDFRARALPALERWEQGSWAKMFYDTPQRSLIGGTIRIDTNRADGMRGIDRRTIRFEAASGISDVRDLDRQMSAKLIIVVHPDQAVIDRVDTIIAPLECHTHGVTKIEDAIDVIKGVVSQFKPPDNPKAKAGEPKAIMIDFEVFRDQGRELMRSLKSNPDTSYIPIIPIIGDESAVPHDLLPMMASLAQSPITAETAENVLQSVFLTGFRLSGGPLGMSYSALGHSVQVEIDNLLSTVFGPGGAYRRMMVQIANIEQRPTIAFEFKLVPIAPYDFFFLDYEWSGPKDEKHRFDWLYSFGGS